MKAGLQVPTEQKKAIHANTTLAAHDAWHVFGEDHGISLSGIVGAMAQQFAQHPAGEDLPAWMETLVKDARSIDSINRRRNGRN